jgi:hypothetical protein
MAGIRKGLREQTRKAQKRALLADPGLVIFSLFSLGSLPAQAGRRGFNPEVGQALAWKLCAT